MEFTHLNEYGNGRMVDISGKEATYRTAKAQCSVFLHPDTLCAIRKGTVKKGDVLSVAQIAGINAVKNTAFTIPLCHNINITFADIAFNILPDRIVITSTVKCKAETGAEMEALNAASVCALTVYDMCKSVQKDIRISDMYLISKEGGKSGVYNIPHVVSVCTSEVRGTVKKEVPFVELKEDYGIVTDAHAGNWHRQVSLLAKESADKIENISIKPGLFAENILTQGITLKTLNPGVKLGIGDTVLEITQIGKECHSDCTVKQMTGQCIMPKEGVFARVIRGGFVYPGCRISLLGM